MEALEWWSGCLPWTLVTGFSLDLPSAFAAPGYPYHDKDVISTGQPAAGRALSASRDLFKLPHAGIIGGQRPFCTTAPGFIGDRGVENDPVTVGCNNRVGQASIRSASATILEIPASIVQMAIEVSQLRSNFGLNRISVPSPF